MRVVGCFGIVEAIVQEFCEQSGNKFAPDPNYYSVLERYCALLDEYMNDPSVLQYDVYVDTITNAVVISVVSNTLKISENTTELYDIIKSKWFEITVDALDLDHLRINFKFDKALRSVD